MKYIFLVAWREYAENAKTKGFWIGIFLLPAILFLSIYIPIILERKGTPTRHFVVVDQSGELEKPILEALEKSYQRRVYEALKDYERKYAQERGAGTETTNGLSTARRIPLDESSDRIGNFMSQGGKDAFLQQLRPRLRAEAPPFTEPRRPFQAVPLPSEISAQADLTALAQSLKPFLRGDKKVHRDGEAVNLYAAILVPPRLDELIQRPLSPRSVPSQNSEGKNIEFWSSNLTDKSLRDQIKRAIDAELHRREFVNRGLDLGLIREVEATQIRFASLNPKKEEGKEQVNTADVLRNWMPVGFVYLLWLAIFSISQMLLNNLIEEKSNRIIEVLLSSVTPWELMIGKLAGISAVGLTMVSAWLVAMVGILFWVSRGQAEFAGQMLNQIKTSNLLPAFLVYFLFGYLIYATLFLALGSVCNTLKEAQNYMGVITMIMMVPLLTMMFIAKDPNGTIARVLSWIPLYTPFLMMNRAAADPPLFELIGTMVLLVASVAIALWMAGKIFRIGILRTGQPPRFIEILRWLKPRHDN